MKNEICKRDYYTYIRFLLHSVNYIILNLLNVFIFLTTVILRVEIT